MPLMKKVLFTERLYEGNAPTCMGCPSVRCFHLSSWQSCQVGVPFLHMRKLRPKEISFLKLSSPIETARIPMPQCVTHSKNNVLSWLALGSGQVLCCCNWQAFDSVEKQEVQGVASLAQVTYFFVCGFRPRFVQTILQSKYFCGLEAVVEGEQ